MVVIRVHAVSTFLIEGLSFGQWILHLNCTWAKYEEAGSRLGVRFDLGGQGHLGE